MSEGMKHIHVIFRNAVEGIQSGVYKAIACRCSTVTARSRPLIHTHTQVGKWDLLIAHPPCTYLTVAGNRWFNEERYGDKATRRKQDRQEAIGFFMKFVDADCEQIAIENPIGIMSTVYRKPDQIIQPYQFGDPARKATCLWLKGLQPLQPTNIVEPEVIRYKNGKTDDPWHYNTLSLPPKERARKRSETFPGIAKAMAEQWG